MSTLLLRLVVSCTTYLCTLPPAGRPHLRSASSEPGEGGAPPVRDRGQATTEYALVLLGAAAIAVLVIAWATAGGGAGKIGRLFDRVIDAVLDKI